MEDERNLMMIMKLGDFYISVRLSNEHKQTDSHVILADDSSVFGEYINGVFVVKRYVQDTNIDLDEADLINKIARSLALSRYTFVDSGEESALLLKPKNGN